MNFISKLWVKTKFYTSSIIQLSALVAVTLYATSILYSMIFIYAYLSSQYLISFFLTLFTIMAVMGIFNSIAQNIWINRNSMKDEVWSSILNEPETAKTIFEIFELKQRIAFLTQYDSLGDTALKSAVRSNNAQALELILEKLSLKP